MKQSEIAHLLPGVFQRTVKPGTPLWALLDVMEALHAPSEEVLARLDRYFDPYQAPDAFVPYLASWVDLERLLTGMVDRLNDATAPTLFPAGLGRLRELIAAAVFLSRWRGTNKGLIRFLETATGFQGYTIQEQVLDAGGRPRPFHLLIQAPAASQPLRPLIQRIIESEKPAYVTYELNFVES
ncbi:MAG: phage tail protein [Chloroflexota bacterium]